MEHILGLVQAEGQWSLGPVQAPGQGARAPRLGMIQCYCVILSQQEAV